MSRMRGLRGGLPPDQPKKKPLITRNLDVTCNVCEVLKKTGDKPIRRLGELHKERGAKLPSPPEEPPPDLRQVTYLTKADWNRIHDQLHAKTIEQDRIAKKRAAKQRMIDRSKEIVGKWDSNTLAAEREQKLAERSKREKQLEKERQELDLAWDQQMAEERRVAIENAKRDMYYQTDRVKRLHGALLLVEVLKEREAQIELKKLRDAAKQEEEEEFLAEMKKAFELSNEEDNRIARERKRAMMAAQKASWVHMEERRRLAAEEREAAIQEGLTLQKLANEDLREHARQTAQRLEEQRRMQMENMVQIEDCKRMRELNKRQEEEEDEECREFALAKRKMLQLRGAKEKSLRDEKLARLEALRGKLEVTMKKKASDEDERLRLAEAEKDAKRMKEEKEKEEYRQKLLAQFFEHRENQMRRKAERLEEERKEEAEALRIRAEADEVYRQKQTEKQKRRKQMEIDLSNYHRMQAAERYNKEEAAFKEELARAQASLDLLEDEENMFQNYAQKLIQSCEEKGRNTYPLRRKAEPGVGGGRGPVFKRGSLRPSYVATDNKGLELPTYHRESTDAMKEFVSGKSSTKERLGFVWTY